MRLGFFDVFEEVNGGLKPRMLVKLKSVVIGTGVVFTKGVSFGGVNIFDYYGSDIEAEYENGILVIRGFYQ